MPCYGKFAALSPSQHALDPLDKLFTVSTFPQSTAKRLSELMDSRPSNPLLWRRFVIAYRFVRLSLSA